MAPNSIVDACRAMKSHGFSKTKTKAALTKLLKLYDNSWEFIIEDDYKVLIEAIRVKEQEEEVSVTLLCCIFYYFCQFLVFGLLNAL